MSELQYTSINTVLAKFHRDLRGTEMSESDIIEWVGEALEFLKVQQIQDQSIAFMEVKDHHAEIPKGFQMVLQIARNNRWTPENKELCSPGKTICEIEEIDFEEVNTCADSIVITDANGFIIENGDVIDYRPYFDLKFDFPYWTHSTYYRRHYTPVRLSNHTLFNSIVCKEKVDECIGCTDEYTIVGTTEKRIRTSFREGYIAMSYLKNALDEQTGYPLIPDQISYITAITYYIQWKIAQMYDWNGREGYARIAQDKERLWLKYAKQAKNFAKMPKSIDDFQDHLEQTHYLIPNHKKYYGYFGNLGRSEQLKFNLNLKASYGYKY